MAPQALYIDRREPRFAVRALAVVLAAIALRAAPAAAPYPLPGDAAREYEVKAAYIFNFLQFVAWPPSAFDSPSAPLRVCTAGDNPFGATLANTLAKERVNGRPLAVANDVRGDDLLHCHVLFVAGAPARVDSALRAVGRAPVLTVGESPAFERAGGIVEFVIVDGRVRFDVNARQASASGLSLSARLLQVARHVNQ